MCGRRVDKRLMQVRERLCDSARRSNSASILAGSEDTQHPHVPCRLAAPGIGHDLVKSTISAVARQFPHACRLADRVQAGVLRQTLDCGPYGDQSSSRYWSSTGLGQPTADRVEIGNRLVGIGQLSRQTAAVSATGVRNRQLVFRIQAVDPGLDRCRTD